MLALAYALGVTRFADAFYLANLVPNMIYELVIGGILTSVLMPVISGHLVKNEREEANKVLSSILNLTFISLGLVVLLGIFLPHAFIYTQTFFSGIQQPEMTKLMAFFFRFFIPQIIFYTILAIFTALLYAERRFAPSNYAPIFNNLVVIIVALLFPALYRIDSFWGTVWLAAGTTAGVIAMTIAVLPAVRKMNFKWKLTLGLKHPSVRKLGILALPVFGYVIITQIGLTVTNNLAWRFDKGVTALAFAWTMFQLSYALFSFPITNTLFPNLSDYANQGDMQNYKKDLSLGIRTIGFLILPATLGILVLADPLVSLLFRYGKFDQEAVKTVAPLLQLYVVGTFSFGIWMLLTRAFYALQDSKTPMLINAVGVTVAIPLKILFVNLIMVKGIPLVHAIMFSLTSILALARLRSVIGPLGARKIISSIARQLLAAIFMALVLLAWLKITSSSIAAFLSSERLAQLFLIVTSAVFGVISYLISCKLLKVEELEYITKMIKRKK